MLFPFPAERNVSCCINISYGHVCLRGGGFWLVVPSNMELQSLQ